MSELLFENEYIRCELDKDREILKHIWLQKPSSDVFRSTLMNLLEVYKTHEADFKNLKWLANTVNLGELTEADEIWLDEEWDEMLFREGGVKVHAVVLGSDIYADYPMEMFKLSAIQRNHELGVHLEVFATEEKAYDWLEGFN